MSALGACGAAPLPPAAAPADATVAAPDSSGVGGTVADAGSGTQGVSDSGGGTSSFQKLMNKAQAAEPAQPGSANNAAPAQGVAATASTGSDSAAMTAAAANTLADGNPLAQLLQLTGQGASAGAGPASLAPVAPPAATAARQIRKDSDADVAPQDDPLALVLATLAQLGLTQQPTVPAAAATASATPAASVTSATVTAATASIAADTALAAAADSAATTLGSALPKAMNTVIDGLAARLRPGAPIPLPGATNSDANAAATPPANVLQLEPTLRNITLRDLLDGNGGDATSRTRDPVEVAASARPADGTGLQAMAANDTTRAADAVTRTISIPVQHPRWAEAVSSEIRWFAEQGVQGATLRLTPEHLGPVEVRLSLADNQVSVNFSAASAETRAALEQSLPRLREMLAGAGLSLGEAQVQQQSRQGSQNGFNAGGTVGDTDVRDTLARVPMRLGLVDEYA